MPSDLPPWLYGAAVDHGIAEGEVEIYPSSEPKKHWNSATTAVPPAAISLEVTLASVSDDQSDETGDNGQRDAGDVDLGGPLARVDGVIQRRNLYATATPSSAVRASRTAGSNLIRPARAPDSRAGILAQSRPVRRISYVPVREPRSPSRPSHDSGRYGRPIIR